ncbi:class I adenylate-forming enzyme family protein [Polymorphobacter sp.]|uniref:class I adenylate-forming enzyme family protein n=1 Tax=Polymorphobacter sp. TaxID=1909290 RepID=UPI003F710972
MMAPVALPTVYTLVAMRARTRPDAIALISGEQTLDYRALINRVDRFAADFAARGIERGDRIAILSENCIDYTIVQLACAKLGVIAACQNWRLAPAELRHCIALVAPRLLVVSGRHADTARQLETGVSVVAFATLGRDSGPAAPAAALPEDGLLIIYTSGTTGLPKAAVISHRAEIARMAVLRLDLGWRPGDAYVAWAPMFHMGGTEHLLATLMSGDTGIIIDGFDADAIIDALVAHRIGWLLLVPATIEPLLARLDERRPRIRGVGAVGCMADLVPATVIAAITRALNAPYLDSFGATETGMPPLSAGLIPIGTAPSACPKQLSSLTELELVDSSGRPVAPGEPGEARMRGATLFSGYWNADAANAEAFRDGWFHMGDLFRATDAGHMFVGRSKYLIKSGGENIYPAEIERVLLADDRVADAIVVRQPDPRWGEVPVAVIARADDRLDIEAVAALCRAGVAGYKQPRRICFIAADQLPRSASGKIIREAVEAMLANGDIA